MCHVLVIEDDYLIATHVAELAMAAGASTITFAPTQADAVTAALNHPPALILSDVRIRDGSGPGAVQAILARLGSIPVVFITGSPEQCEPRPPGARILAKPFAAAALSAILRDLVTA